MKQSDLPSQHVALQDIVMPKNTSLGLYIGIGSFLVGFGFIWHIGWLIIVGAVSIVSCVMARSLADTTEYVVPAAELKAE